MSASSLPENQAPHNCCATDCTATIAGDRLMCRRHWNLVPLPTRLELQRLSNLDQTQPEPSLEYLTAVKIAIDAVAVRSQPQEQTA